MYECKNEHNILVYCGATKYDRNDISDEGGNILKIYKELIQLNI